MQWLQVVVTVAITVAKPLQLQLQTWACRHAICLSSEKSPKEPHADTVISHGGQDQFGIPIWVVGYGDLYNQIPVAGLP